MTACPHSQAERDVDLRVAPDVTPRRAERAPAASSALTADKLERFKRYQEALLNAYRSGEGVRAVALLEEAAREQSGLSAEELDRLEDLVSRVIGRRALARSLKLDESIGQMRSLRDALPERAQQGLDRSIDQLARRQAELEELSAERAEYGEEAVALVLQEEEVLTRQWESLEEALSHQR